MRRWYTITVVTILIAGLAWRWFREDPDLGAAREAQARLAALGEGASIDERRAAMRAMRDQFENLTEDQRRALFSDMRAPFENRLRAAVDGYFALPATQRQAYLDQQIRQMEQRRTEMQQRFASRPPRNPGEQRGGPGGGPRGDRPGGGPGGGGGGGREQRMLDRQSPVDRAKNTAYFSALEARRKQLGLPSTPFGR